LAESKQDRKMEITFEKWEDGRWFVILPEWDGLQEDLEMVDGADTFLDFLTTDGLYVTLDVSLDEFPGYSFLELVGHDALGGTYQVRNVVGFDHEVWLCNVVHFLFGEHPENIYFKVL
jgi:hypothetical protein